MLTCIVVDDDPQAINVLTRYIEKTPFLHLLCSFTEPVAALAFLQSETVDLIFSDIEMPDLTGIEFLKILGKPRKVILSTAHGEYALEGYEHDVVDFLMKPVSFDRFLKAVQKALNTSSMKMNNSFENPDDYVLVKTGVKGRLRKISMRDIYYVEGLKNYVSIYTQTDRIIALLIIKDLEKSLPSSNFMRIHKSYIVAIDKMDAIEGNQVILKDIMPRKVIPLGSTYRDAFFHMVQDRILGRKQS